MEPRYTNIVDLLSCLSVPYLQDHLALQKLVNMLEALVDDDGHDSFSKAMYILLRHLRGVFQVSPAESDIEWVQDQLRLDSCSQLLLSVSGESAWPKLIHRLYGDPNAGGSFRYDAEKPITTFLAQVRAGLGGILTDSIANFAKQVTCYCNLLDCSPASITLFSKVAFATGMTLQRHIEN